MTKLTARQQQVLAGLADGLTYAEIAVGMHLSPWTVKVHARNLYAKFGAINAAHAVALGFIGGHLQVAS